MKACRIWIFDIGRGFASAILTPNGKWILIDLGAKDDFNPVSDFTIPKLKAQKVTKNKDNKYLISQLIITHPHDDHMTSIQEFDKRIYSSLLTVPNDVEHEKQPAGAKVNWKLIKNPTEELTDYLRKNMFPNRLPPLRPTEDDKSKGFIFRIYYLLPSVCEDDKDLSQANYANNISVLARLNYKGNVVLFCGDMMKDGMSKLLSSNKAFRNSLSNYGVDYLIVPHHGLRSSFSTELFQTFKHGKTRALNIISERPTRKDSNEIVDDRYGNAEYCLGRNNLQRNGRTVRHVRTSAEGHIRIILFESGRSRVTLGNRALSII